MNNLDKIYKKILRNMSSSGSSKPTLAIVYDSILEIYPKLKDEKIDYKCKRKVIIEELTNLYDTNKKPQEIIKKILSRFIHECLNP